MPKPDYSGARAWAKRYAESLKPRMAELREFPYETEELLTSLGGDASGYDTSGIVAVTLPGLAKSDPNAFDAMRRIISANRYLDRPIPENWKDFERRNTLGELERPTKRGASKKGTRDLIYSVMAEQLTGTFGLPLGRNDNSKRDREHSALSACELIKDEMTAIGERPPDDRTIEKAVRRFTREDRK